MKRAIISCCSKKEHTVLQITYSHVQVFSLTCLLRKLSQKWDIEIVQ